MSFVLGEACFPVFQMFGFASVISVPFRDPTAILRTKPPLTKALPPPKRAARGVWLKDEATQNILMV